MAVPKTMPVWGEGLERFATNVEKITKGELSIKVYGAGELVPALETFAAVQGGEIQMGHSASYYWAGKIPASVFFCTIPFGMSAECLQAWVTHGDGQSLWDELMHPHGVTCRLLGSTGYQMSGWFNKEIKTVADLKGLKIRIPGLASKVYSRAGAVPVLLPGGEVFTGLSTGVIDAVEWIGPYNDYVMGLHRAAKYCYADAWNDPGPYLELMINKQAWDKLSEDTKEAVIISSTEASSWMKSKWEAKNGEYLAKMKSEKIDIRNLPQSVLNELKKHTTTELVELSNTSPLAKKIYDSYTSFMNQFESYQKISTGRYYESKWG